MPTHAPRPTDCLRWILATCLGACVGTPTPEPPDTLPPPRDNLIFGGAVEVTTSTANTPPIPVGGQAGAVPPSAEVWVVNLDRDSVAPLSIRADSEGRFRGQISAQANDRVRIVARTDTQHSLPLDAYVMPTLGGQSALAQLPAQGLSCVRVAPEDLTAIVGAGKDSTREITLRNTCSAPITVDARLRFGDAGFAIDVDGDQKVRVRITGHEDAREHADIVLLDVRSGAETGRYAIGVWSVADSAL